jgi:hypothetical protein
VQFPGSSSPRPQIGPRAPSRRAPPCSSSHLRITMGQRAQLPLLAEDCLSPSAVPLARCPSHPPGLRFFCFFSRKVAAVLNLLQRQRPPRLLRMPGQGRVYKTGMFCAPCLPNHAIMTTPPSITQSEGDTSEGHPRSGSCCPTLACPAPYHQQGRCRSPNGLS